jgi:carboxypeptidase Taq
MTAYDRVAARFARIATLGEAGAVLGWDASAMMPPGGAAARGDQLAVLAGVSHGLLTAPEVADELAEAEGANDRANDPWRAANLELMRHAHLRATALPGDLVEARARANSACEKVWREARAASDFSLVSAYLADVVRLTREAATLLGPALGLSPYDALMDGYQRGVTAAEADKVFARYEAFLGDALPRAEARQAAQPAPLSLPSAPEAAQEGLCRLLSQRAGLDFAHARLDRSAHPFCGGSPTDIRITTRYDEADPARAVRAVLHETGHALYESGLPAVHARQPVGEAAGMAAHESQSLIVEMQACLSDAYLAWLGPEMHGALGGEPGPYEAANLARLWRRVERSFIRVDADEMTYPAHVILRFRLERAMVADELQVADLPGAWNEGLKALLGIVPPDDARGCLQDIHWYDGLFGYFPSYSLGAMAAAQLMDAAREAVPQLDAALGRGDLGPLVGWLRERVHAQASLLGFRDLLRAATGRPLDPSAFERHLAGRYLG